MAQIRALDMTVMAFGYDEKDRLTSVSDGDGNITEYQYGEDGNLTGITDSIGVFQTATYDDKGNVLSTTNGAGDTAAYKYDSKGNCTSITISREENGETLTFTSRYSYNAANELISSIDNAGKSTTYQYDKNGNMTSSYDAKGRRTTYAYDELGNLTKVTYPDKTSETFTYDANGNNITATDRNGLTVTMEYDKLNRPVTKTYPDGTKETYEYDAVSNVTAITSVTGARTEYTYDERNRNTAIKDALGNVTAFEYDDISQLTARTDALGNTTRFEYDKRGNIIKTTYADGNSILAEYDARNRCISQTDQNGNRTTYEYDGADRLTKVTDAAGGSYSYTYDANGNLRKVTSANGNVTSYDYDAVGRVSTVTNAAGKSQCYEYDAVGNVTKSTDYAGVITTYKYDNRDRLIQKIVGEETVTYKYNTLDQLVEVTDKSGTIRYTYDEYGRMTSITDAMGNRLEYTYDETGHLKTTTGPAGTVTYEYDILGRLVRVTDRNGNQTTYEYDAAGNRKQMTYANGVVTAYQYDSCHRLTEETVTDKNGSLILKYTYVLGKAGERIQISEITPSGTTTTVNLYDSLNRLVNETITDGRGTLANEYVYDAESNRTAKTTRVTGDITGFADPESDEVRIVEGSTTYEYNELNQLIKENAPDGAIVYNYDANGNLVSKGGTTQTTFRYDGENRLLLVTIQDGNSVTTERYTYDHAGNRTSKTVNEEETQYYVVDMNGSLSQVSAKVTADGTVIASYIRGEDLISMEADGKVWYYIADGHGSIRALIDEEGNITDSYSYDAFGNVLTKEGDTENDYRYTGEEYNELTGLYYLRARYMDPSTGTFISMDSYPGRMNDPVSLHKYLYANANPVMNTDPTGYSTLLGTVMTGIQNVMTGISVSVSLHRIMGLVEVVCTVYDTVMVIKDVIFGNGSIMDIMYALARGLAVAYVIDYIYAGPLGLVLRPLFIALGFGNQFQMLMEAIESGDTLEITVQIIKMTLMAYDVTKQEPIGESNSSNSSEKISGTSYDINKLKKLSHIQIKVK